jgi:uncharacterized protein (TIGR03067 family)
MVRKGLGLAVLVVLAAGTAADDAAKAELDKLQGEWQMVSSTNNGKELPAEAVKAITRVVKGNSYTLLRDGQVLAKGTVVKLDPSKTPKTMDVQRAAGGKPLLGIYELDGDTHKVCLAEPGKDRPTVFSSQEGSGQTLTVWKRKK